MSLTFPIVSVIDVAINDFTLLPPICLVLATVEKTSLLENVFKRNDHSASSTSS